MTNRNTQSCLSHVFWMLKEQTTLARRFCHLLSDDHTYQSKRYGLNVGLFVRLNNLGNSCMLTQPVVVPEKARDFLIGWRRSA